MNAARANALGTALILDGIPFSNNANLQNSVNILNAAPGALPAFSSVAGRGNDLRQIPADQVEEIEVIRGIPSARYGDLTTGAILVTSRAGVFKPQFTTRLNPNLVQQSLGFGTAIGKNSGVLAFDGNYTYSEDDPRNSLAKFSRITGQLTWTKPWLGARAFTTNRLAVFGTMDNQKQHPDDRRYQRRIYSRDRGFRFSSNGKFNTNWTWLSKLSYDFGISSTAQESFVQELITRDLFPVSDALTEGTREGRYGEAEYLSQVHVDGRPVSLFARLEATLFQMRSQSCIPIENQLLLGSEYRLDGNEGEGRSFDPSKPPRQNYSMGDRPRTFNDIPSLSQLAFYIENRLKTVLLQRELLISTGLRFDNIAPTGIFAGRFGSSLAPRINFSLEILPKLQLRGGFGLTTKSPTLSYLYPGLRYFDLVNFNYYASNPSERLVIITTKIFDANNTNLKAYRAKKFELGLDFDRNQFSGNLTAFVENMSGAFGTNREVYPLLVAKYGASSFPVGSKPVLNAIPNRFDTFYAAVDRTTNNRRIQNQGLEFQFDSPIFPAINTSINFTGAWILTKSFDDGWSIDASRAVFSQTALDRIPIFKSGFGNSGERLNTSLRFITKLPKVRFLLSGLVQTVWKDSNRNLDLSPFPIGFIDKSGAINLLDPEDAKTAQYTDLRRQVPSTSSIELQAPPLWLINLRATKAFNGGTQLAFYVNNFLADRGNYFNPQTQSYTSRNQNLFFGAEFTINL